MDTKTEDATTEAPNAVTDVLSMCCGKQKCPEFRKLADGSVEIRDDDAGVKPMLITSDQASELRSWLKDRGY